MDAEYRKKIEDLYLQMYPMLFEYARSSMNSDALAEEAVQDTFTIACQKVEMLISSPNPKGWLVNTLKNVIRNTLRNQNTARKILQDYCAVHSRELTTAEDQHKLELIYGNLTSM